MSLVYWSTAQVTAVGWTQITDAVSSNAFADAIAAVPRPFSASTAMAAAINFGNTAGAGFLLNGFEGARLTADISGDGSESVLCASFTSPCVRLQNARDNSVAQIINALWIEDEAQPSVRKFFCLDASCDINPLDYGMTNVLKGGGFQAVVADFDEFAPAVREKIFREITAMVPIPAAGPHPRRRLAVRFGTWPDGLDTP